MKNKSKNKNSLIVVLAALIASTALSTVVKANTATFSSESDPIIALSYLNEVFLPQIMNDVFSTTSTLEQRIGALENSGSSSGSGTDNSNSNVSSEELTKLKEEVELLKANYSSLTELIDSVKKTAEMATYQVIFLNGGEILFANNTLEVILRSGSASAISPFTEGTIQGLNNLTLGQELLNGDVITINHSLLIPRGNDGRGVVVTSPQGAYLMVKGDYTIVK